MLKLENKNILVIGAAGGIGLACSNLFLENGANLILSSRNMDKIQINHPNVRLIPADLQKKEDIENLFKQIEDQSVRLDGMIFCSGIESSYGFENTSIEHFDKVMEVNLRAAFLCAKHTVPLMNENGGSVVLVNSQKGLVGSTGSFAYNVSKGGMTIMTRSMAMELGDAGIRVNSLCPGPVETPMLNRDLGNQSSDVNELKKRIESNNIIKRIGEPMEIAKGALFLISDDSSYMTGTELVIDGGNITGAHKL